MDRIETEQMPSYNGAMFTQGTSIGDVLVTGRSAESCLPLFNAFVMPRRSSKPPVLSGQLQK
jgi:hypothetical protein